MIKEEITVTVNGVNYTGWKNVRIEKNLDSVSGSFQLSVTDIWTDENKQIPFKEDHAIKIKCNFILMMSGYIDKIEVSDSAKDRVISISGREKTADLVDCSPDLESYEFTDTNLYKLALDLCAPFSISVFDEVGVSTKTFKWSVQQGETIYQTLERAARKIGVLLIANDNGDLVITAIGSNIPDSSLIAGENILSGSYSKDYSSRFSKYIARGQSNDDEVIGTASEGISFDKNVSRNRPKIILIESGATLQECQDRANWESSTALARSESRRITVQGWYQSKRQMFEINQLIKLDYPRLFANNIRLLISSVAYNKSNSGTYCEMTLINKDAFIPQKEIEKDTEDLF